MDYKKIVEKIEHDLSHYLISELTKNDPSKRQSADLYKYKGLTVSIDPRSKSVDKTIKIRIGALEAEFRIAGGDKCSGSLSPKEEKLLSIWLSKSENTNLIRSVYALKTSEREYKIIPFDLEAVLKKSSDS